MNTSISQMRSVRDSAQTSAELSVVAAGNRPAYPPEPRLSRIRMVVLVLVCGALATVLCACRSSHSFPEISSKEYAEAVSAFYVGLGALQVGDEIGRAHV